MAWQNSPFHKFQGVRTLVLIGVTLAYTAWYVSVGPYGQLAGLAPGMPLEERGFYTGQFAVDTLAQLTPEGERTKLISLAFDFPYMILTALMYEAMIAFGLRRLDKRHPRWNLLFALPILFVIVDFAEDSFLALTLVSGSIILGSLAGVLTVIKFLVFIPVTLVALIMGVWGLGYWFFKGRQSAP